MKFNHSTPIQIRFNDIDLVGHVYNAKYQEFFDLATIDYFKQVLGDLLNWTEKALVIASIKIDYSKPVYLDDEIQILSNVVSVGEKSLEMFQRVIKKGQSEPVATGKTILVCFNIQKKESIEIPEEWKKRITDIEKD